MLLALGCLHAGCQFRNEGSCISLERSETNDNIEVFKQAGVRIDVQASANSCIARYTQLHRIANR